MAKKREHRPEYGLSSTNLRTMNYAVYYMKPLEKALYFIAAFAVGAAVGYLFYGGIGKNEFGEATALTWTLNIVISATAGLFAGFAFLPMRTKQIIASRKKKLSRQFRDMLDGLTTSLGAGNNVPDSFLAVYDDLKIQYEEDAYILRELEIVIAGMNNNTPVEDILTDFGARSDIEDIKSFANVFRICYRKGGNIRDIIRNTQSILADKMEIREDIETVVTSNKLEQNLMLVMPVALIGVIKFSSPDFAANFTTVSGIVSTTIALGCFVAAYFIGKAVLNIKM